MVKSSLKSERKKESANNFHLGLAVAFALFAHPDQKGEKHGARQRHDVTKATQRNLCLNLTQPLDIFKSDFTVIPKRFKNDDPKMIPKRLM